MMVEGCGQYEIVISTLTVTTVALFGWLMKAKADHFKDLRDALAEANERAARRHQPNDETRG